MWIISFKDLDGKERYIKNEWGETSAKKYDAQVFYEEIDAIKNCCLLTQITPNRSHKYESL